MIDVDAAGGHWFHFGFHPSFTLRAPHLLRPFGTLRGAFLSLVTLTQCHGCLACRAHIPFVFIALHSFTLLAFSFRFASTPFSSIRLHFFHQMFVTQSSFITLIAYTAGIAASSPFILSPFHSLTLLVSFHYNSIHRFESFIP